MKAYLNGKPLRLRRQVKRAWKNRKKLPEGWLEYKFGIVPLVGSIQTLATALSKDLPYGRVRATGKAADLFDNIEEKTNWGFRHRKGAKIRLNVTCRLTALITGINPHKSLAALTGVYAPLSSAWSVVPWGWAADYFLNVGELISNLEPRFPGVSLAGEYTTYKYAAEGEHANEITDAGLPFRVGYDGYPGNWSFNAQYFGHDRRPGIDTKFKPEFSGSLDFNRLANLISALYLSIKGR